MEEVSSDLPSATDSLATLQKGGMEMIIGLPVVEGHELSRVALDHLTKNVVMASTKPVIIDNASETPYNCDKPFEICKEINGYKVGLYPTKRISDTTNH